jgi:hypothetical protein
LESQLIHNRESVLFKPTTPVFQRAYSLSQRYSTTVSPRQSQKPNTNQNVPIIMTNNIAPVKPRSTSSYVRSPSLIRHPAVQRPDPRVISVRPQL